MMGGWTESQSAQWIRGSDFGQALFFIPACTCLYLPVCCLHRLATLESSLGPFHEGNFSEFFGA